MHWYDELKLEETRREFLGKSVMGIGSVALASLLGGGLSKISAAETPMGAVNPLHFAPKAKRVIHLYMAGGPSHLELLDYKPELAAMHGKPMRDTFTKRQPIAQLQGL